MKKYLNLFVTLMVMLFAGSSFAYTPPPAPASGWYVSDQAGKLTTEQLVQLNQKIDAVSKSTKNEFGILLLQDMNGDNIEDVAYTTFNTWGIGKHGLDNGCLIVVALKERKSRIETGKGVGGEVSDLQASDILKNNLNPHLKQGDFAGGFNDTLDALSSLMESRQNAKSSPAVSGGGCSLTANGVGSNSDASPFVGLLSLFGICFLSVYLYARVRARRRARAGENLAFELAREQRAKDRLEKEKLKVPYQSGYQSTVNPIVTITPVVLPVVSYPTVSFAPVSPAVAKLQDNEATKRAKELANQRAKKHEADRKRQQQDDDDNRRRSNDDSSSSSSSSSSFGGGSDFGGGGFGGGSSGGGGASGDF